MLASIGDSDMDKLQDIYVKFGESDAGIVLKLHLNKEALVVAETNKITRVPLEKEINKYGNTPTAVQIAVQNKLEQKKV